MMESFRENVREAGRKDRSKHRESDYNRRRGALGDNKDGDVISPEDVKKMAMQLKSKHKATLQGLIYLKQAFLQQEGNIAAFLECNALHIIIRELSGQHEALQLAAADCCCNLSLGNAKHCLTLTKTASAYLITNLYGYGRLPLLDVCAWTLGNLAASSLQSWSILHNQGLGAKLTALLASNTGCTESVAYALTHYVRTGYDQMTPAELEQVALCVCPLLFKEPPMYWLGYLLSCSASCEAVFYDNSVGVAALHLLASPGRQIGVEEETALLRILGNLIGQEDGRCAMIILTNMPAELFSVWHSLLTSPHSHLRQEVMWLIGNLIKHPFRGVQDMIKYTSIQSKLVPFLSETVQLESSTSTTR